MSDAQQETQPDRVIVTGGTRGIGRAVSEAFLQRGARVFALYRGNREAAEAFRADLDPAARERLEGSAVDVADYAACEAFFKDLAARDLTPTVLVNAAGIRRDQVLAMLPKGDWDTVIQANLSGTFHMCKFAVQAMMPQRYGRIVSITSPSGQMGFAGQANYAASKAGQVALTKSLSKEVATRGITVNAVSPGYIETDLIADLPPETVKAYKKSVPVRRFGTPAEVAHAVVFLAQRASAYITGAVLEVTGGL